MLIIYSMITLTLNGRVEYRDVFEFTGDNESDNSTDSLPIGRPMTPSGSSRTSVINRPIRSRRAVDRYGMGTLLIKKGDCYVYVNLI